MERVDFHVHYQHAKNGSSIDVINNSASNNIGAIALMEKSQISPDFSDHIKYGEERGVKVFTGMEVVTKYQSQEIGLVCLGFDHGSEALQWWRSDFDKTDYKSELVRKQYQFMLDEGYVFEGISDDEEKILERFLKGKSTEGAIEICRVLSNLPVNREIIQHLQDEMSEEFLIHKDKYGNKPEYAGDFDAKFIYNCYFAVGRKGNFAKIPDTRDVIDRIRQAKGVSLYSPEGKFSYEDWNMLLDFGIDGIMGWHAGRLGESENNRDIPIDVIKDILRRDLLVLGGSDYQGRDWKLGYGDGSMYISNRRLDDLVDYLEVRNKVNV